MVEIYFPAKDEEKGETRLEILKEKKPFLEASDVFVKERESVHLLCK